MVNLIKSIEYYECTDYDRYIYIERTNGQIVAMNYCQGCGSDKEQEYFINGFCKPDKDLYDFYSAIEDILAHTSEDEVERFNLAIEAHFNYLNNKN
jgi:hypothetical protein